MPATTPNPHPGAGPRAVDMHAHHWPAAMITALHEGREWFGWRAVRRDDGRLLPALGERVVPLPVPPPGDADPQARIRRRHELRIGLEALMPAGFLWNYELPAELAAECCRVINTEMAGLQRDHPASFRALATLPMQDPELALAEIDHCTQTLGVRSFSVASSVNGRNLDDPAVMPVLDHIASLGATLSVHPPYWEKLGAERMPRYRFTTRIRYRNAAEFLDLPPAVVSASVSDSLRFPERIRRSGQGVAASGGSPPGARPNLPAKRADNRTQGLILPAGAARIWGTCPAGRLPAPCGAGAGTARRSGTRQGRIVPYEETYVHTLKQGSCPACSGSPSKRGNCCMPSPPPTG